MYFSLVAATHCSVSLQYLQTFCLDLSRTYIACTPSSLHERLCLGSFQLIEREFQAIHARDVSAVRNASMSDIDRGPLLHVMSLSGIYTAL